MAMADHDDEHLRSVDALDGQPAINDDGDEAMLKLMHDGDDQGDIKLDAAAAMFLAADEEQLQQHQQYTSSSSSSSNNNKRKRRQGPASTLATATAAAMLLHPPHPQLRKAPQAPKRFKSSYICFFLEKQSEIKKELGNASNIATISRRSAELWKKLPPTERQHFERLAEKDKQRFMNEKALYSGPWQVPYKRARKDPSAPKRPMSAFLYFAQERRTALKELNPTVKNTEISKMLGEQWRKASEEVRRPFVELEKVEREKYKIDIGDWRQENEAKIEEQRTANMRGSMPAVDIGYHGMYMSVPDQYGGLPYGGMPSLYGQPMPPTYGYPYNMIPPPPMGPFPYGPHVGASNSSNKPMILGPNGMPIQNTGFPVNQPGPAATAHHGGNAEEIVAGEVDPPHSTTASDEGLGDDVEEEVEADGEEGAIDDQDVDAEAVDGLAFDYTKEDLAESIV